MKVRFDMIERVQEEAEKRGIGARKRESEVQERVTRVRKKKNSEDEEEEEERESDRYIEQRDRTVDEARRGGTGEYRSSFGDPLWTFYFPDFSIICFYFLPINYKYKSQLSKRSSGN